jgi:membrane-associated phospholipid phosphatase
VSGFTDRLLLTYWTALTIAVVLRRDRVEAWGWVLLLHAVVIAAIVVLRRRRDRWPHAHAWYPLLVPLIAFQEAAFLSTLFADGWQDHHILALEARLFDVPPTVWLGQFRSQSLSEMLQFGYLSYFLFLPLIGFVLYRRADQAPFFGVMAATMLAYIACYAVFLVFPTEGPAHTLRHLHPLPPPEGPLASLVQFIQRAGTHGNAFPSAHVAGAIVPAIFATRYAIRYAPLLFALMILLCVGAVYDRYHYVSDIAGGLVIGVAAAWFVLARATWRHRRNTAATAPESQAASSPARPGADAASHVSK